MPGHCCGGAGITLGSWFLLVIGGRSGDDIPKDTVSLPLLGLTSHSKVLGKWSTAGLKDSDKWWRLQCKY